MLKVLFLCLRFRYVFESFQNLEDHTKHHIEILKHLNEISMIDFDHTDVVRHPLVSKIVKAYSDHNFKK